LGKSSNFESRLFQKSYISLKLNYLKLSSIINNRNLHACNCKFIVHFKVGKDEFKHDGKEKK
jgi:hypothetical protein